jgi:hypothetical protein
MFLITYVLTRYSKSFGGLAEKIVTFHYDIAESVEEWVDEMQKYEGEEYILINAFPISKEQAEKWDGNLHSM